MTTLNSLERLAGYVNELAYNSRSYEEKGKFEEILRMINNIAKGEVFEERCRKMQNEMLENSLKLAEREVEMYRTKYKKLKAEIQFPEIKELTEETLNRCQRTSKKVLKDFEEEVDEINAKWEREFRKKGNIITPDMETYFQK